ncbi:hypothetical protein AC579_4260 [Pseudocercospora musae]|uniref:CP-type G domain-containing protein n=1 Tax=Pseudocercospora musae TaxID=113226 RepID=A0A139I729_9PEZI|nr:hypothetical protein AC579_4260 [Pseudocercospora musae]KXT10498.1 hypothetical protein AC579_4260 [Pseudocercospora musae]
MTSFIPRNLFPTLESLPRSYYLGHHAAGLSKMRTMLSQIDLIVECRDYRIPMTSRNPMFEDSLAGKERMIVYTKKDLGSSNVELDKKNEQMIRQWHDPSKVVFSNHKDRKDVRRILDHIKGIASARGSLTGSHLMVVGMPNVGKSSLLNALRREGVGKGKAAHTGAQPGVTRKIGTGVKIVLPDETGSSGIYLLDTPGVFMPYVPDADAMLKLALCGSVKDTVVPALNLADYLLFRVNLNDPRVYADYSEPTNDVMQLLDAMARKTGRLMKGAEPDLEGTAIWMVQRWRTGHLGTFLLDEVSGQAIERYRSLSPSSSLNQARKAGKQALRDRARARRAAASSLQDLCLFLPHRFRRGRHFYNDGDGVAARAAIGLNVPGIGLSSVLSTFHLQPRGESSSLGNTTASRLRRIFDAMAQTMSSAVALPEDSSGIPTNGLKRRHSGNEQPKDGEEDSKKRRTSSSGKNSPIATPTEENAAEKEQEIASTKVKAAAQNQPAQKADATRESRRKSGVADERQRSKRLFGALLGNLNQPGDRVSKRRGEIEQRKKAELQKQDDERLEDRQRRVEKLAIERKREQIRVDEEDMRIRHKQMLNTANFLQTRTEPRLYYRPWDLLPDEEDRIEDQVRDAQAEIDKELDAWDKEKEERLKALEGSSDTKSVKETTVAQNGEHSPNKIGEKHEKKHGKKESDADNQMKSDDTNKSDETAKSAEIPESDQNAPDGAESRPSEAGAADDTPKATKEAQTPVEEGKDDADDEDHVVEGDEDNVIY